MKRLILLICLSNIVITYSQQYPNKESEKKNEELVDSLKSADYPYVLPIWGEKATKAGFSLPYSAGISTQYVWQQSDLIIENLMVGFNNGEMYDLSQVVRFNNAVSQGQVINLRPDLWVFPFLNVYGIFARSLLSTSVDFGLYVPDSTGTWNNVENFSTVAEFNATSTGFGITPTLGVAGGWIALDMNFTWNDIPELDEPAFAFIFGPRFGKTFKFKKPESNIAVWAGGFRLKLNTGTQGSLAFNELFEIDDLQTQVDNGIDNVNNAYTEIENWWNSLTALEQKNPINEAKYETATNAIATVGGFLNSMDATLNQAESSTVQYSLDKRPKDAWNFVLGSQYQINKSWMLRLEVGFLGSRTQVISGLQYRFGL